MKTIERIVLYTIALAVGVILFLMFRNKKDTNAQSSLLMAMAEKLKVNGNDTLPAQQPQELHIQPQEVNSETIRIADKLYFNIPLTKSENNYYTAFTQAIDTEYDFSKQFHPLVQKFVDGNVQPTEEEKIFYEANKDLIDAEVQKKKLQVPSSKHEENSEIDWGILNNPPIKNKNNYYAAIKGANPPLAADERLKIILSLFEDEIPKTNTQLAQLYSIKTGTPVSVGISNVFGRLEGKQLLYQELNTPSKDGRKHPKKYYGLPEWFDGKKLKPEYKNKVV